MPETKNPYEVFLSILTECKIKLYKFELKAVANNVFIDAKETYNVFLFFVNTEQKPTIKTVPEGDEIIWIKENEIFTNDKVLDEYKRIFPELKSGKILFYHTKYDFDKILNFELYN